MFSWCTKAESDVERSAGSTERPPFPDHLSDPGGIGVAQGPKGGRKGLHCRNSPPGKPPRVPKQPKNALKSGNKIVPLLTDHMSSERTSLPGISQGKSTIRNYSGEELARLGFAVYSSENLSSHLATSSTQPLAFLAVETQNDVDMRAASMAAVAGSFSLRHQNKLVPVHVNTCCEGYFSIGSYKEYALVIRKLLKRDPLLTFALQKALRFLKVAEHKSVNHVTPDPSGQTSSLFGMRISPCVWEEDGRMQAALLVEHNVPYNPAEVMPRLMRDYAVLSHVPAILTLIDFQGKVLYQNASSLAYMGDLLSARYDRHLSGGLLKVLFAYDLINLEQMFEDVLGGLEWQGVVQVPYSIRRFLATKHTSVPRTDGEESPFSSQSRSPPLGAAPMGHRRSTLEDELEVQFQIGNSFTTRGLVGTHKKGQMPGKGATGTVQHLAPPPGLVRLDEEDDAAFYGATEMLSGPSDGVLLPQNRIMSILERAPAPAPAPAGTRKQGHRASNLSDTPDDLVPSNNAIAAASRLEDPEEGYDDAHASFHEIHAIPLLDPVLDKQVIMLVQTDVTPRVELENRLADLTEAQLSMLEHLFPRHIIEFMLARVPGRGTKSMKDLANTHDQVMVLFCDVVGFTSMSKEVEPSQVLHFLNELYQVFDDLLDEYGMYKLDIVGDCYIVVAGLIKEDQDGFVCVDEIDEDQITSNAVRIMQFAKAMLRESKHVLMPHNSEPVNLRIGIHTGKLVSGLIGSKMPKFTLFGDTMNTASRMESTCRVGCVHVSDIFGNLLPHEDWEPTGGVEVKGKGLMQTRLWVPNTDRQELIDLDAQNALPKLRQMLTMASFASTAKSRALTDFGKGSVRSRHDSCEDPDDEGSNHNSNPLMAILQNLRGGGDDDDCVSLSPGATGHSGGAGRPKSAYIRLKSRHPAAHVRAAAGGDERASTSEANNNLHTHGLLGGGTADGNSVRLSVDPTTGAHTSLPRTSTGHRMGLLEERRRSTGVNVARYRSKGLLKGYHTGTGSGGPSSGGPYTLKNQDASYGPVDPQPHEHEYE